MNRRHNHSQQSPGDSAPCGTVRGGKLRRSWLLIILFSAASTLVQAQDISNILQQERDVKVAIVFKLLRFVEWPSDFLIQGEPLKLCVWPGEPYTQTFKEIEGSRVASHSLFIEQLDSRNSASCHVLFSSSEKNRSATQWRAASNGKPILTISDAENFAAKGGMIHLMMRDQRVVFSVNVESMDNAALRMSALVLNLAEIQQSNTELPQIQTPIGNSNE
ncbi:MAG: YfiR family protein [Pseudomonadota bacterium]